MSNSSFHMFIYAGSEQCDLRSIYDNKYAAYQNFPGKLKSIPVKISPDPGRYHGKHAKEKQILFTFLAVENLSRLPCSHECKYRACSDLSSYAVNSPG